MRNILKKHLMKLSFGEAGLINLKNEKEFHALLTKIEKIQISKNQQRHVRQKTTPIIMRSHKTTFWKSFSGWSSFQASELIDKLKKLLRFSTKIWTSLFIGQEILKWLFAMQQKPDGRNFLKKENLIFIWIFWWGRLEKISKIKGIQVNEKLLKTARKPNSRKLVRATKTRRLKTRRLFFDRTWCLFICCCLSAFTFLLNLFVW